jgi:hypothetical protein
MGTYSINNILTDTGRFKLYALMCNANELIDKIAFLKSQNINVVNVGKELANYIDGIDDYSYLAIDVYDYCKKLLNECKTKINDSVNDVVAIYNLGILLEPVLGLNTLQLFKEFSKSTSLIIIWENQSDMPDRLVWPTQTNNFFLNFSDTQLKKIKHEI